MIATDILDFLHRIGCLKTLPRTGWRLRGVGDGESVADHAFRVVVLAMVLADGAAGRGADVDVLKVLRMAVLHDLGESEIGDIPRTALAYLKRSEKDRAETQAMRDLTAPLGPRGAEYMEIWDEMSDGESQEARLVRTADRLETLVQALEYESAGSQRLDDFWDNASGGELFADFPEAADVLKLVRARRQSLRPQPGQ